MTWLYVPFVQSRFVAELQAWISAYRARWPEDSAPFCMQRGKPFAQKSFERAWKTGLYAELLSFLTCEQLTLNRGVAQWISLWAATPASHFPLADDERVKTTPVTCGRTSQSSSQQYNLPFVSLKTSPATLPWGLNKSAKTYRQWVIQLRREYTARKNAALRTGANGCSFLPTPTASAYGTNQTAKEKEQGKPARMSLQQMASRSLWPTPTASDASKGGPNQRYTAGGTGLTASVAGKLSPQWTSLLMGLPTWWLTLPEAGPQTGKTACRALRKANRTESTS